MQINVRLFGSLRELVPAEKRGKTSLNLVPDATVEDVLTALEIDYYVIVAVNDEQESDPQTRLQPGDTVMVFEAASGG